ncbi:MAG: hypothetical protein KatS3mg132_013 [Limisphaera sp.]|nr:MAG: hypothetical protein KatS3mg132_013 [Limisphaera sp.]
MTPTKGQVAPLSVIVRAPIEAGWRIKLYANPSSWRWRWLDWSLISHWLLLFRHVRETIRLLANYFYDFRRYWRYSSVIFTGSSRSRAAALITMAYHGLEKGLYLPEPRPGFGRELCLLLLYRLHN